MTRCLPESTASFDKGTQVELSYACHLALVELEIVRNID